MAMKEYLRKNNCVNELGPSDPEHGCAPGVYPVEGLGFCPAQEGSGTVPDLDYVQRREDTLPRVAFRNRRGLCAPTDRFR